MTERVRVLVVDDHPVFAQALVAWMTAKSDVDVAGVASDTRTAMRLLRSTRPAVVVLDVVLGEESGLDLLVAMMGEQPDIAIVMLSGYNDVGLVAEAVRRGARGWVPKGMNGDKVVTAINEVARGGAWIPPKVLGPVLDQLVDGNHPAERGRLDVLTAREHEVLQCMVDGLRRSEIAERLYVSENTVRTHTQNLLRKLDVHTGTEAVAVALRADMRPS